RGGGGREATGGGGRKSLACVTENPSVACGDSSPVNGGANHASARFTVLQPRRLILGAKPGRAMFNLSGKKPKLAMGSAEANEATRRALLALGDNGAATRRVSHFAAPTPKAVARERRDLVDGLKQRGFTVKDADGGGLVLEHDTAVTAAAIDSVTGELAAHFKARGWTYDGWESEVAAAAS
ncbi:MAG: ribonuclease E inhibitor RraB, partial [Parvularculaceae bacterium]|nr:ribonuclease E inhibitor RraB [Parvularculaceae bacterium]